MRANIGKLGILHVLSLSFNVTQAMPEAFLI